MLSVIRHDASTGPTTKAEDGPFTGEIWRDLAHFDDEISVGNNYFTPCARTHWHTHPGGQLLIIVSGEGFVADEDGAVKVTAGDMVWTPPNVRHWHGAADGRAMLHTAVTFGGVVWQEAVTDDQYTIAAV